MPQLRVVPLQRVLPHEEVDPLRVSRLTRRLERDRVQLDPVVCIEGIDDDLILLDGATRAFAIGELGCSHLLAQVVEPEAIGLDTWHHVIHEAPTDQMLHEVATHPQLELGGNGEPPLIRTPDGNRLSVRPAGPSRNRALRLLVDIYQGHWPVNRVIDLDDEQVEWRYPGWSFQVEFPRLDLEDVLQAAVSRDLLPAGVTRFLVPGRALRVGLDLDVLRGGDAAQDRLERLIEERVKSGRVRRYQEPVVVFDN